MSDLAAIIDFLIEVEKLKAVERRTSPIGLARKENSAEHSWHLCVLAILLQDKANAHVDMLTVLKMLILHDLGEIDAGDTLIYAATEEAAEREEAGMRRLCQLLPSAKGDELMALWLEFAKGVSAEAQFARAIDRVPPIVQNLQTDGQTWRPLGISQQQVLAKNDLINEGCAPVWAYLLPRINAYFQRYAATGEADGQ